MNKYVVLISAICLAHGLALAKVSRGVLRSLTSAIELADLKQVKSNFEKLESAVETPQELKTQLGDLIEVAEKVVEDVSKKGAPQGRGMKIAKITGGTLSSLLGLAGVVTGGLALFESSKKKPDFGFGASNDNDDTGRRHAIFITSFGGTLLGLGAYLINNSLRGSSGPSLQDAKDVLEFLEDELADLG